MRTSMTPVTYLHSFHVGSLPEQVSCFETTIAVASQVFGVGERLGLHMDILDIGGGFPGVETEDMSFNRVSKRHGVTKSGGTPPPQPPHATPLFEDKGYKCTFTQ